MTKYVLLYTSIKLSYLIMGCNRSIYSFIARLFIARSFIARLLIAVTALQLQYHYASMQMNVYNNSVIELIQCFGTSFFGLIDFDQRTRSQNTVWVQRPIIIGGGISRPRYRVPSLLHLWFCDWPPVCCIMGRKSLFSSIRTNLMPIGWC